MLRLVAAILLMTVTTQAWAEKVYNTPKAKASERRQPKSFQCPPIHLTRGGSRALRTGRGTGQTIASA